MSRRSRMHKTIPRADREGADVLFRPLPIGCAVAVQPADSPMPIATWAYSIMPAMWPSVSRHRNGFAKEQEYLRQARERIWLQPSGTTRFASHSTALRTHGGGHSKASPPLG